MSFDQFETSASGGEPVLLFDFFIGLAHWRYTTADRSISYLSNTFIPAAISAGSINQGQEIKRKTLSVIVPADLLVVQRLQQYPPSGDLALTITALHYDDPAAEGRSVFIGRVMSQSQVGITVTLACEPAYTGVQTVGLRRRWQLNCPHVLYAPTTCTLNAAAFKVVTNIGAVAGPVITCPGLAPPAGLAFPGGYVEWDSGNGYFEQRSINAAAGGVLTLAYGSPDLVAGLSINAYPGCDHSGANCNAYGNILNYGGELNIPGKNPMSGNPVY